MLRGLVDSMRMNDWKRMKADPEYPEADIEVWFHQEAYLGNGVYGNHTMNDMGDGTTDRTFL